MEAFVGVIGFGCSPLDLFAIFPWCNNLPALHCVFITEEGIDVVTSQAQSIVNLDDWLFWQGGVPTNVDLALW